MSKQTTPPVKGTRDFYPEQMAFRNWLYEKVKEISQRFGYQEYDGPEIEYLDLYAGKTSEEILREQVFILEDRDGKKLALRPELTPTFARMIAQKSIQLIKPIRWFSFGRAWRYEQPQKGRAREFFQWEINLLGPENPEADAEILAIAATYLKELGLTSDEVVIRVSDREWLQNELRGLRIMEEKITPLLRIMDRKDKISPEAFEDALLQVGLNKEQVTGVNNILIEKDYTKSPWLKRLFELLEVYGISSYIQFDPQIIRGFQYYTRTVFEAWDRKGIFKRAIFGGGRFDNLTAQVGGERVPGVGMAPGDMPTQVILEQNNKQPKLQAKIAKVLVTVFNPDLYPQSLQIVSKLQQSNIDTEIWPDPKAKLDKQLKYADQKNIPFVIVIGPDEVKSGKVTLKDLNTKSQSSFSFDDLINKLLS